MIATDSRKVYLHGYLGTKFGREFSLSVNTATEAVRLLNANFPDFISEIRKGEFQVVRGDLRNGFYLEENSIEIGLGKADLHFVPVPVGSKKSGMGKVLIGVALIGLSFAFAPAMTAVVGPMGPALAGGMGATIFGGVTYGSIAMMGLSMALGGLGQLMTPKVKNYNDNNSVDSRDSFITNGPVNAIEQGGPVPLIYGRIRTGSVLAASSITTEQI